MRTIRIYGASDDLVEFEGTRRAWGEPDEVNTFHGAHFIVHDEPTERALALLAEYTPAGCWAIGIAPADEGAPMPDWPLRWSFRHNYSAQLELDAPDSARVRRVFDSAEVA